jgi:hypothetical protein
MHAVVAAHLPGHLPAVHSVAVHGLIGAPLAVGIVVGALGAGLWIHEHHWQRFTCWCFAVSAACFTVAIPPLFGALAGLTTTGTGLAVLAVLAGFCGLAFYLQAVRSHRSTRFGSLFKGKSKPGSAVALVNPVNRPNRHRRVGTPMVSIITGALFVVVVGAWRLLLKNASTSVGATLHQLATSSAKVNNGQAAAAVPASHRPEVYIFAGIALLVIFLLMRRFENRKKRGPGGKGSQGAPRGTGGIPLMGGSR